jgi:hypothetical protein
MRALLATELLKVWERGVSETPARRAIILLETVCDEVQEVPQFTIGRRDGLLLTLREKTFGSRLCLLATCPQCGEQLETELDISSLRVPPPLDIKSELFLRADGHEIQFHLLNSADLAGLSAKDDDAASELRLLKQCVRSAKCEGREIPTEKLPPEVVARLAEKMAQADPQAEMQFAFRCPACGHTWQELFDIVSFFWTEINACALRLLREVHILAATYGWSETEILRLSPQRRSAYLQLLNA